MNDKIGRQFLRELPLFKEEGLRKLKNSRVAVFGLGGVGSFCAEALVRAGVGALDICDSDAVDITNLNRQLVAYQDTVGRLKTEVFKERAANIHPDACIRTYPFKLDSETISRFPLSEYTYVADCIDDVPAKLLLAEACEKAGVRLIMAMGAGNKLDPTKLEVSRISKTSVCPLARRIRREFKERRLKDVKCVFSKEEVKEGVDPRTPASVPFVPSVMGLIMAGEILKDIVLG